MEERRFRRYKGKKVEKINIRLKRLTDRLLYISDEMISESEDTGSLSDRTSTIHQQLQAVVEELKTITQQADKEVAENIKIKETLKALDEELKHFIYMTSHDFREPLRKISSFGSILKESLDGTIESEDQEYLGFMIDGAERMNQMIEDLLAYSRINTKAITIEDVDLNNVVEQLETLDIGNLLKETGAHIEISHPLLNIRADAALIRQLLRNLIIYAIKQHKEDTPLQISIGTERISDDEVKIECEYNGMDAETKNDKDIFKMSLHSHSRQEYEEAGTGLAVCKKIIDRHGGRIGIESKEAGSKLWFILPVSKRSEQEQTELLVNQTGSAS